jgi:hypothetical protein
LGKKNSVSSKLRIARTTVFPDTIRAYRVVVDGETIGALRGKQELVVPLKEGHHSICVRVDWCGSRTSTFEAKEGEEVVFNCGSALANWRVLIALVYVFFLRDDYLWLKKKEPNQPPEPTRPFGPSGSSSTLGKKENG